MQPSELRKHGRTLGGELCKVYHTYYIKTVTVTNSEKYAEAKIQVNVDAKRSVLSFQYNPWRGGILDEQAGQKRNLRQARIRVSQNNEGVSSQSRNMKKISD